jgi:hypothetical protein
MSHGAMWSGWDPVAELLSLVAPVQEEKVYKQRSFVLYCWSKLPNSKKEGWQTRSSSSLSLTPSCFDLLRLRTTIKVLSSPPAHSHTKQQAHRKQALEVRGRLRVRVFDGQGCGDCFPGYLQLLQQLTMVGEISEEAFAGPAAHLFSCSSRIGSSSSSSPRD